MFIGLNAKIHEWIIFIFMSSIRVIVLVVEEKEEEEEEEEDDEQFAS